MNPYHRFRAVCMAVLVVSVAGIYCEVYLRGVRSLPVLYGWAAAAIAALAGSAVAALLELWQTRGPGGPGGRQ